MAASATYGGDAPVASALVAAAVGIKLQMKKSKGFAAAVITDAAG